MRNPWTSGRSARAGAAIGLAAVGLLTVAVTGIRLLTRAAPIPGHEPVATEQASPAPLKEPPLARPPAVSHDYVGSTVCRQCHSDVWERYQSHPMAHSLSSVRELQGADEGAASVEFTRVEFTRGKRTYSVEHVDDKVYHHERQIDAHGEAIYDQALPVHYAIGSGKRGHSYLINREGVLFMSPLSWYSQTGQWDLTPGYPEDGHERFGRRISERCLSCHAGRVAPDPDWSDRFDREAPVLESMIGCERCHGPGKGHVARHRAADLPEGDDPIINPARLEPTLRESVCNQCHLPGEEFLRYGRTDFDFRPGMHVGDVWSILVARPAAASPGTLTAVSQAQQMASSQCAQASAGRLGCISCHDPHEVPAESERDAFFREKCLACHSAEDCREKMERRQVVSAADSCIVCHMPRLASEIPHTTQTDHSIPRRSGRAPQTGRPAVPGSAEIFDIAAAPLSELEQSRAHGLRFARMAMKSRITDVAQTAVKDLEPVVLSSPDDNRAAEGLALAWSLTRHEESAIALWKRLLAARPVREETLLSLALAQQRRGEIDEALAYWDRLLEANPWRAESWLKRSQLLRQRGRESEALDACRKAIEVDPSLIEAYLQLSELCSRHGLDDEAARCRNIVQRLKGPAAPAR